MPKLLIDLALGGKVASQLDFKVGIKYRWLLHELRYVIMSRRPKDFLDMLNLLELFKSNVHSDIVLGDLGPTLGRFIKIRAPEKRR